MSRRTDGELIARSERDGECFGAVFDRHFAQIHRYIARRAGRDVADELAVETFVVAFRRRCSGARPGRRVRGSRSDTSRPGTRHELAFDPHTSALIGERTVSVKTGVVTSQTVYVASGIVGSATAKATAIP